MALSPPFTTFSFFSNLSLKGRISIFLMSVSSLLYKKNIFSSFFKYIKPKSKHEEANAKKSLTEDSSSFTLGHL